MKRDYIKLGQIIKMTREEMGFSRRKMAALVDISDTELKRIEDGERQVPNLITIINICKLLGLDLLNLLEDTGFYEREEDKLFYIILKNKNVDVFKIHAQSDIKALLIMIDLLSENDLIEQDENIKNVSIFVTEDEELLQKVLVDFKEKTEEEIAEKYNTIGNKFSENYKNYQEIDEDYDEIEEECDENCSCETCKYYCPYCGECTFGE